VIPKLYICIIALKTLKTFTWMAETCWWSLYDKITSLNKSALIGLLLHGLGDTWHLLKTLKCYFLFSLRLIYTICFFAPLSNCLLTLPLLLWWCSATPTGDCVLSSYFVLIEHFTQCTRNNSWSGIAWLGYRLGGPGIKYRGGGGVQIFGLRPDRPWGPPFPVQLVSHSFSG